MYSFPEQWTGGFLIRSKDSFLQIIRQKDKVLVIWIKFAGGQRRTCASFLEFLFFGAARFQQNCHVIALINRNRAYS